MTAPRSFRGFMFSQLTAGDSTTWTSVYADYSAADGWAVSTILRNLNGDKIVIAGVGTLTSWAFTITAQTSAKLAVGGWDWSAIASKTTERKVIESGVVWIDSNPDAADTTASLKAQIAKVEEAITARLDDGIIESFSIRGQSVQRLGMSGLQALLSELKTRLNFVRAAELERRGEHGFTSRFNFIPS